MGIVFPSNGPNNIFYWYKARYRISMHVWPAQEWRRLDLWRKRNTERGMWQSDSRAAEIPTINYHNIYCCITQNIQAIVNANTLVTDYQFFCLAVHKFTFYSSSLAHASHINWCNSTRSKSALSNHPARFVRTQRYPQNNMTVPTRKDLSWNRSQ
jgi:hypothetical protein